MKNNLSETAFFVPVDEETGSEKKCYQGQG